MLIKPTIRGRSSGVKRELLFVSCRSEQFKSMKLQAQDRQSAGLMSVW